MRVHKKIAGKAYTLGDLKQFITEAENEGFTDASPLCPKNPASMGEALITAFSGKPEGVSIFLDEVRGEDAYPKHPYRGTCPECNTEFELGANKLIPEHHRGETTHQSTRCYGIGKLAKRVVENT